MTTTERKLETLWRTYGRMAAMRAATEVWEDVKRHHRLTNGADPATVELYRQQVLAAYRPVEQYLANA